MTFGLKKEGAVWLDMDQTQLDVAYDQLKFASNRDQIVRRYASNSEEARRRLGVPKRLSYGASPIEGFDLYATGKPNAPVNIFIHGGAWRSGLAPRQCVRSRALCPLWRALSCGRFRQRSRGRRGLDARVASTP